MSTFVFIPGAGGVAWYWHRVVPLLEQAGHEAIAVDLPGDDPGAGLPEYADMVVEAIGGRDDVVVVAQSMGGFTAALVAASVPLRALVFVNGMIPRPGEKPTDWWGNAGSEPARLAAAREGGYTEEIDLDVYFLHDVPPDVIRGGESLQRDENDVAFESVCAFDSWPAIPIRVVAGADERFFPVEFQKSLARERLGVEADVLPGGHLLALSHPAELAGYLAAVV
jgi:pimeloyl-ACP methyl ester carboxylesterase